MKSIRVFLVIVLTAIFFSLAPSLASARDVATISDWYIKSYDSEIIVNKDSSLDITEKIVADCGTLLNKHGIFRQLPTFYSKDSKAKVQTPVSLVSITDFSEKPIQYSTSVSNGVITWKIGDPAKTVTGINNYKIVYHVKNAIRFDNANFDEFYWNLLGDFWQIDVDATNIVIKFPNEINKNNTKISLYTGVIGEKGQDAKSTWLTNNYLRVASTKGMKAGEGITASVTFPKNIISPYVPTWVEKYGSYLWLIFPLLAFLICFSIWKKNGRDPRLHKTVIAEYGPPDDITPLEIDAILHEKKIKNTAISATIIGLAVKGIIQITEIPKKGLFGSKDFKLKLLKSNYQNDKKLTDSEKYLISSLFSQSGSFTTLASLFSSNNKDDKAETSDGVSLSDLKNNFYRYIPALTKKVGAEKAVADSFSAKSFSLRNRILGFGIIIFILVFWITLGALSSSANIDPVVPVVSLILTIVIIIFFTILMPQATLTGAEYQWKIKGFKLYMNTAEKYREQFNEKENIFEKYLPYAIVFGIVGLWAEKMKEIYGEKYFNSYHPLWYVGPIGNFNIDTFANSIESLSSTMASTISSSPSSSGAGGGGFSGGGGGGGGGGGW